MQAQLGGRGGPNPVAIAQQDFALVGEGRPFGDALFGFLRAQTTYIYTPPRAPPGMILPANQTCVAKNENKQADAENQQANQDGKQGLLKEKRERERGG